MILTIKEMEAGQRGGSSLRGAVRQLWGYKGPEAMVAGPAETGKTYGTLTKVHALLLKYPGCQGAIVRKTRQSMSGSVLASYERKILGKLYKKIVIPYGGESPEWYDYPNGSRLWVGGLDNPDKVLSSERDFIYVNQTEEVELSHWEYLLTRTTGRAGNMPYAQVFGDCNPGPPSHWIINRETLKPGLFHSKHEDNPTLFDEEGNMTEQGRRSIQVLDSLTGVTKERLRHGRWAGAEGVIYNNFDPSIHVIERKDVPKCDRRIEIVDFGYTNAFCWQNWEIDNDGRVYITHEIYFTERTVEEHCEKINRITRGWKKPEIVLCDHDAEDRATFKRHRGLNTKPADKGVKTGIDLVLKRLQVARDGKARFFYVRTALVELDRKLKEKFKPTCSLDEQALYVWNEEKDAPVKENDHGMDTWRYGVVYLDKPRKKSRRPTSISVSGY